MRQEQKHNLKDLPFEISSEARRERSTSRGTPSSLHRWWARRSPVLARVAAYLALTESQTPKPEFLKALGKTSPNPDVLGTAHSHIRDTQWRWTWRENRYNLDEGIDKVEQLFSPEAPRVLDPFAGGGSIPAEAARLGCLAYAGDLNPVSYHILCASLDFPVSFLDPEPDVPGTSNNGTWAGLVDELYY